VVISNNFFITTLLQIYLLKILEVLEISIRNRKIVIDFRESDASVKSYSQNIILGDLSK